ncbi:MAG: transposase [Desulfobulbaceae bacterium]|nr:transposase [Desulfobulbaceae bacterium]
MFVNRGVTNTKLSGAPTEFIGKSGKREQIYFLTYHILKFLKKNTGQLMINMAWSFGSLSFQFTLFGGYMKIPCAKRLPFIVCGLSFFQPALTNTQVDNLTLVATALVLGARFYLTDISRLWLKKKAVSTLSYLFSDAKFSTDEMQMLYLLQMMKTYNITHGYFLIDDTMKHHTKFCKWIHGVFTLFDHALQTNLKAICVVALYYCDGKQIQFPITFRIYYKGTGKLMPWQKGKQAQCTKKYDLAVEMLEWALSMGFPKSIVLADSWYGISAFVKELNRLKLGYVLEIRNNFSVKAPCKEPKLTPKGKLSKNQFDFIKFSRFFESISSYIQAGFPANLETGQGEKILYHIKVATVRLKTIPGKHRIVESYAPTTETYKYLITDQLT